MLQHQPSDQFMSLLVFFKTVLLSAFNQPDCLLTPKPDQSLSVSPASVPAVPVQLSTMPTVTFLPVSMLAVLVHSVSVPAVPISYKNNQKCFGSTNKTKSELADSPDKVLSP